MIGRFRLADDLLFSSGPDTAVSPHDRPNPLTLAYNHAWLVTSRFNLIFDARCQARNFYRYRRCSLAKSIPAPRPAQGAW